MLVVVAGPVELAQVSGVMKPASKQASGRPCGLDFPPGRAGGYD